MRPLVGAVLVWALVSPVSADVVRKQVDAVRWFEGCAALTQNAAGMMMDGHCVSKALEYCIYGRTEPARPACWNEVEAFVRQKIEEISAALPMEIAATGFTGGRYKRTYRRLTDDEKDATCPPDVPVASCPAFLSGVRWMEWRDLERLVEQEANE